MFQHLIYQKESSKVTITLNRPEVFHALNTPLIQEITQAMTLAAADNEVRVVILTSVGDKSFCSGADLKAGLQPNENGEIQLGDSLRANYNPMIQAIRNLEKPVICRLNGVAAGAGMSLALACDVIIAQENAYLSELFVGIGLMPDAGSMFFLPRLIGIQKTFELCSTGRKVFMPEALQLGLVTKVVPAEELDNEIEQLATFYSQAATRSIGLMKRVLNQSASASLDEVLELEAQNQTILGQSHDFGEGVMAFLQKRHPKFKGK